MTVKRLIALILVVVLCFSMMLVLSACGDEEKHTCMRCGGSGRVRDKYGYYAYVSCPRCNGAGYLIY